MPPEKREERFWMVYVDGKTGSAAKHPNNGEAYEEAERLARMDSNKGRKVFVLEATDYCEVSVPVTWSKLL